MVDLREKEAVISLVLKLIPDVPVWHLESVLSSMILHFDGGKGTAWGPLGNAMSKVLQDVQKNGAGAGDENIQMFVAGVQEASEKQALLVERASIERTVHMKHESERAENEIKKLSGSLEDGEKLALGMKAEFLKMKRSNEQLLGECEKDRARYVSASSTAATNSQNVGKLQKKVESQQLQIAKYKSCEVVVCDGVVQPGASQAEVASLAEQVERLGSAMLTKADLTKVTQDICVEVTERQKSESAHLHAEIMAFFQQENAAVADRIDRVVGMVSDLSSCVPQLMGRQGPEEEGMETATDVLKLTPGNRRLKFVSAEELARKTADAVHGLLQLAAARDARQDCGDAQWAFASWKEHVLESARQDKKMFAREGRLKMPDKIHKDYFK
jgi:hypothetical protein